MTTTSISPTPEALLERARAARATADRAEVELAVTALAWCRTHPPGQEDTAAAFTVPGMEGRLALAGVGAPEVAEFAVAEFAAAVRLTTESGRRLLGDVLELAYRLPRLWDAVLDGDVLLWRARRVADHTRQLTAEAAQYVDHQLAAGRHRLLGPSTIDATVTRAMAMFDPERAEERRAERAEHRHVDLDLDNVGLDGLVSLSAVLDAPDALDLDAALNAIAATLRACGSTDSHRVRRALALGELARSQPTLSLVGPLGEATSGASRDGSATASHAAEREGPLTCGAPPGRGDVVLYVHLPAEALDAPDPPSSSSTNSIGQVGTCDNVRRPILAETIRTWCGAAGKVLVRPVIDLNEPRTSGGYVVPGSIAEQVRLRDGSCVFPYCNRPARSCDIDHIRPWSDSGTTATENLAALCRHHHRLKTHASWTYRHLGAGEFEWTSPTGMTFRTGRGGTRILGTRTAATNIPDPAKPPSENTSSWPPWARPATPVPLDRLLATARGEPGAHPHAAVRESPHDADIPF